MNFVNILVRMFARQAVFGSGKKLFRNWTKGKKIQALKEEDISHLTPHQQRKHAKMIARKENLATTSSNPWIFILLIIVGVLLLYIITQKK